MDSIDPKSIQILDNLVDAIQSVSQSNLKLRDKKKELTLKAKFDAKFEDELKDVTVKYVKYNRKKQRILQTLVDMGLAKPTSLHIHGKGNSFVGVEYDNQSFYVFYHQRDSKKLGLKNSGTMPTSLPKTDEEIKQLMPHDQALKIMIDQYALMQDYINYKYELEEKNNPDFQKRRSSKQHNPKKQS